MEIKGAIFDMDGTIVDSMAIWGSLADEYLQSVGVETGGSVSDELREMNIYESVRYFIKKFNIAKTENEVYSEITEFASGMYLSKAKLKPHAAEYIRLLRSRGVKTAVATANAGRLVRAVLEKNGIYDLFDAVLTSDDISEGKTNPRIYEEAARLINTKKSETAVFEDALHAVKTAKAAGFYTVGVYDSSSERDRDEIIKISDRYIVTWSQLLVE